MERFSQKQLRALVKSGAAIDLTHAQSRKDAGLNNNDYLTQVGYSAGVYGCNGKLLKSEATGKLYAITARTTAIYLF